MLDPQIACLKNVGHMTDYFPPSTAPLLYVWLPDMERRNTVLPSGDCAVSEGNNTRSVCPRVEDIVLIRPKLFQDLRCYAFDPSSITRKDPQKLGKSNYSVLAQ